jgi:hypothetical protein
MYLNTSLDGAEVAKLITDACPGAVVAQTKRKTTSAEIAEVLYKVSASGQPDSAPLLNIGTVRRQDPW